GHGPSRSLTRYDEDLNILPFSGALRPNEKTERTSSPTFERMKSIAKSLAADFDFVRVDLYESQGKVYFGELTFSPNAGLMKFNPDRYDYWMGQLWKDLEGPVR
ncbi:MAG: ATP-grasp fold amidoligase family protein, partial [Pseudomonadota bacterium]